MIKASYGLSEKGSVRDENQDSYLIDTELQLFAVADGLGGLPNGSRASQMSLEVLQHKVKNTAKLSLATILGEINEETREIGYRLSPNGFGTTLTLARQVGPAELEIGHIGDSAACLVRNGEVHMVTVEHTLAARMVSSEWAHACEAIPASAHHTLTQCIGQELYIDPQITRLPVLSGDRFFLMTDGVTKAMTEAQLEEGLIIKDTLERVCEALTFRIEIAGSPDNYSIVALEF